MGSCAKLDQSQWDFMALLPMHPYFENSTEEFHPYKTLSTPMKLLLSLFVNTVTHQPI
jgi:hypothetical protein